MNVTITVNVNEQDSIFFCILNVTVEFFNYFQFWQVADFIMYVTWPFFRTNVVVLFKKNGKLLTHNAESFFPPSDVFIDKNELRPRVYVEQNNPKIYIFFLHSVLPITMENNTMQQHY